MSPRKQKLGSNFRLLQKMPCLVEGDLKMSSDSRHSFSVVVAPLIFALFREGVFGDSQLDAGSYQKSRVVGVAHTTPFEIALQESPTFANISLPERVSSVQVYSLYSILTLSNC